MNKVFSAKEAHEALKTCHICNGTSAVKLCGSRLCNQAIGYLLALEGSEVKSLVKHLELVDSIHDASIDSAIKRREARIKALEEFTKAVHNLP